MAHHRRNQSQRPRDRVGRRGKICHLRERSPRDPAAKLQILLDDREQHLGLDEINPQPLTGIVAFEQTAADVEYEPAVRQFFNDHRIGLENLRRGVSPKEAVLRPRALVWRRPRRTPRLPECPDRSRVALQSS
ncbi:MAG TPA: hypothetical protein VGD41_05305 [Pyrinomonadaceae bacterium]